MPLIRVRSLNPTVLDDKGMLPSHLPTDSPEVGGIRVFGKWSPIHPDGAEGVLVLEEHKNPLRGLHKLKRLYFCYEIGQGDLAAENRLVGAANLSMALIQIPTKVQRLCLQCCQCPGLKEGFGRFVDMRSMSGILEGLTRKSRRGPNPREIARRYGLSGGGSLSQRSSHLGLREDTAPKKKKTPTSRIIESSHRLRISRLL